MFFGMLGLVTYRFRFPMPCFIFYVMLSAFISDAKTDKTVDTVGDKSFWDRMYHQRQKRTELFQWPDFKPYVLPRLQAAPSPAKILMIGCGDSPLGADLFQDLNQNAKLVGVDYSEQAIAAARRMHAENFTEDQMAFVQLDIKEIDQVWATQGRDLIDVGFDKGTFDCFREDDADGIAKALQALGGALTPSGTLFIMSHETEEGMRKWLQVAGLPWVLKTEILTSRILKQRDPGLAKLMRMQLHRFDKGDPSVGPPNLDWAPKEEL
eukprot:gnl/MRDRNA2_/MRDRNA2_33084_c0_seq2.p1 gnl/MRDRNA2_/MRDRNA2_33084_c0~~gnl/MRDRNA2_/MRDRNA2_33084_c0_seq2.p1  ORF type:complete len:266 (+),score=40.66 gnl/MRDRNA2_/MRDRNA2_33084_c0_seq2:50-847(+)